MSEMRVDRALARYYFWYANPRDSVIDPNDENARGKFARAILESAQGAKTGDTLPKDIRRWSKDSIDMISGLRTRGSLGRADLYNWESEVTGKPKIVTILGSIFEVLY